MLEELLRRCRLNVEVSIDISSTHMEEVGMILGGENGAVQGVRVSEVNVIPSIDEPRVLGSENAHRRGLG
ncbi:hypothetical protein C8R44DRAFT_761959 [Mycena epipterygia]|nr:hypothetical protein C8R44DRAFT_761959 [Mycena epipterygia]